MNTVLQLPCRVHGPNYSRSTQLERLRSRLWDGQVVNHAAILEALNAANTIVAEVQLGAQTNCIEVPIDGSLLSRVAVDSYFAVSVQKQC